MTEAVLYLDVLMCFSSLTTCRVKGIDRERLWEWREERRLELAGGVGDEAQQITLHALVTDIGQSRRMAKVHV